MKTETSTRTSYDELIETVKDISLLGGTMSILSWDQETLMPPGGIEYRSRQMAQLARMLHERGTAPRIGELLEACESDDDLMSDPVSDAAVNVRDIRRSYDRSVKLPGELVTAMALQRSVSQHSWAEARKENNFSKFEPNLRKSLDLARQAAGHYGWPDDGEEWDALAEGFEPGMTAASVSEVFTPLRERLVALLGELMATGRGPSNKFNELILPIDKQESFVRLIADQIGFDFNRGRLDVSTHPFCGGSHCNDVRMTTRFRDTDFNDAIGSTMHESGHGIYNQGLPPEYMGTPVGSPAGLAVHESQSRMWENQVGRSEAFWKWAYPKMTAHFGDALNELTFDEAYGGANRVAPSLIRVEADEATYNMHIMIRFEIERMLLNGSLDVADLPDAWNQKYRDYLDVEVPDDQNGCLQDIHWSMGAFGYFPTYTLGNLYCAQFFEAALEAIPDLYEQFARGEFGALKTWLNENIHAHGSRYRAPELCVKVTGKPLSADPLLRHLESKLRPLYGA